MLNDKQIQRMLKKLQRFETTVEPYIFTKVGEVPALSYRVNEKLHNIPPRCLFREAFTGDIWGGENECCWFLAKFTPDRLLDGQMLFIRPNVGGTESLLWVNGMPAGIFTAKTPNTAHGEHYCNLLVSRAVAEEEIDIAIEAYAGYYTPGSQPLITSKRGDFLHTYTGIDICVKNKLFSDFYFDLKTFNQMAEALDQNSFVRANIIKALTDIHRILYYSPDDSSPVDFLHSIELASSILRGLYEFKNTALAPIAAVIGHSHMDTAWHWPLAETVKKCVRTYSNQLSLMEQYPEYMFVQSSAYHCKMVMDHYPRLFERIREAVAGGRYEPNGGVWVECDCNIVSGETMLRQFLWGQRYTLEQFGYKSNCFWLPDTFGYSAAIPQIMKGCGVDYFLTTKIAWNDTNKFPYDTFYWQGIDGTMVLSHFNKTHLWPDPKTCIDFIFGGRDSNEAIIDKKVSNTRLLAYGHGDGGGGPTFEMIEMARRAKNIEGCPKVETMKVGDFMERLEASLTDAPVYRGELYLELHRGTLTNQHTIKRNNRLAEIAIHNAEYLTVRNAVSKNEICRATEIRPLLSTLLINQFHDILPGTCVNAVHTRSIEETSEVIKAATKLSEASVNAKPAENMISLVNTLSFDRDDIMYIDTGGKYIKGSFAQQMLTTISGKCLLAVSGLIINAFSSRTLELNDMITPSISVFKYKTSDRLAELETPFYKVVLDERNYIVGLYDKTANRELRGTGYAFNTLLIAEDVPMAWDNWDIDADSELKYKDCAILEKSEVVSDGEVEFRIRSVYRITDKSSVTQDMIFYGSDKSICFETQMDWQDDHRLLKAAFDTSVYADFASQEIQFGYVRRPTTRNNDFEKAKFEVCNHKYTDISETRYGIALINDCKYGISVFNSSMWLTLHKGGNRPDHMGDHGVHICNYSLVPHLEGFGFNTVIKPAYMFNYEPLAIDGIVDTDSFARMSEDNIIIETVKSCEDECHAFILRMYEAEGTHTNAVLSLLNDVKKIEITDMLERPIMELSRQNDILLSFRPFEIKTIKVSYNK